MNSTKNKHVFVLYNNELYENVKSNENLLIRPFGFSWLGDPIYGQIDASKIVEIKHYQIVFWFLNKNAILITMLLNIVTILFNSRTC